MNYSTGSASHWKRKRNQYDGGVGQRGYENRFEERQRALAVLTIQAHEADIVHGLEGKNRAQSLEVDALGRPGPRSALISLGSDARSNVGWNADEDNIFSLSGASPGSKPAMGENEPAKVWVDRYDARLLLDTFTLLSLDESAGFQPPSPALSAWSDFPEDSEETFFLTQEEVGDYHRRKRRRLLDESYARRVKEREEEDEALRNEHEDSEPTAEALTLMQRTATHLLSASNPAQLEIRILANHGADERFSFLRDGGRWHEAWVEIKIKAAQEKEKATSEAPPKAGLGGIAGYGSDSESDGDVEDSTPPEPPVPSGPPPPSPPPPASDPPELSVPVLADNPTDAVKEERRARAREWMLSRRKEKA